MYNKKNMPASVYGGLLLDLTNRSVYLDLTPYKL